MYTYSPARGLSLGAGPDSARGRRGAELAAAPGGLPGDAAVPSPVSRLSGRARRPFLGCSGRGVSRDTIKTPSPISALGVESPHLQLLRVNKLLVSNPSSSKTTSLSS